MMQYLSFNIGPISINTWGFFVSIGFAVAIWVAYKQARVYRINNAVIVDSALWIIIFAIIGARFGHVVFYELAYYREHLNEIIRIDQGGMSSFGGFIGAGIGFALYARKKLKSIGFKEIVKYMDSIMFAFPLGWVIGRIGCFLIFDHPGKLTEFVLGVQYVDGIRHNLGLYEVIDGVVLFLVFLIFKKVFEKTPGMFLVIGSIWYGVTRFFLDFLRATDLSVSDARYFGLTPAQYGSILLVGFGIYFFSKSRGVGLFNKNVIE